MMSVKGDSAYELSIYKELHRYPEIGFSLDSTLKLVRRELDSLGVPYVEEYGRSSIVATLNPDCDSYTVAIRADMDALPITEATGLDYSSECEGVMHACGHDAHTAMALGALRKLARMDKSLIPRVKFIFQAAEEYPPSGAMLMAEDGVMDGVDEVLALHVSNYYPVGEIAVCPGYINANSDGFTLDFYGENAHVAAQQFGKDAISMAVRAYTAIEFMIAKEISPREPIVFNAGRIEGGTANNVIADRCSMYCTLRTHDESTEKRVLDKIKAICSSIAELDGGRFEFAMKKHYPAVYNDPEVTERLTRVGEKLLGSGCVRGLRRALGGEDFSYFLKSTPGCMFKLGTGNKDKGIDAELHTASFRIDTGALTVGRDVFVAYVLDCMDRVG